jgi:hypothetical protein
MILKKNGLEDFLANGCYKETVINLKTSLDKLYKSEDNGQTYGAP